MTGYDPYCIYNELDPLYRPLYDDGEPPLPPPHPNRVEAVKSAFGSFSWEMDVKLAGHKYPQKSR